MRKLQRRKIILLKVILAKNSSMLVICEYIRRYEIPRKTHFFDHYRVYYKS